jgi:hypothetical protein
MDKRYQIEWRNPKKTILVVNYLGDSVLDDVLASNLEAFAMIKELPHEVILIHNGGSYNIAVELLSIGKIHDVVYSQFPAIPQNLKFVIVILASSLTRIPMGAGMEVLDILYFRRRMTYTVSRMEEAERLIAKSGF